VGKGWDNYYHVQDKAREFGMKKGWFTMLAGFELAGIIIRRKGFISLKSAHRFFECF